MSRLIEITIIFLITMAASVAQGETFPVDNDPFLTGRLKVEEISLTFGETVILNVDQIDCRIIVFSPADGASTIVLPLLSGADAGICVRISNSSSRRLTVEPNASNQISFKSVLLGNGNGIQTTGTSTMGGGSTSLCLARVETSDNWAECYGTTLDSWESVASGTRPDRQPYRVQTATPGNNTACIIGDRILESDAMILWYCQDDTAGSEVWWGEQLSASP